MSKQHAKVLSRKTLFNKTIGLLLSGTLLFVASIMIQQQSVQAADVVVYKSATCGCCKKWVSHLEENGFSVEVHNEKDMNGKKNALGIPRNLRSCHTAEVAGYLIEGHVPADLIARLLQEKPKVRGLAVPGMPMGSPGMEGSRVDPYDILTFTESGKTSIYDHRN